MQYNRNYDFTQGQTIIADQVDQELNSIANVLNTGIDTDNLVDGAITADKTATSINPETRAAEIFVDGVYTGLTLTPTSGWSNRLGTITSGVSYIRGKRVSTSAQTDHTFTASKDTYVDLDKNMNFTYKEETLGAAEPAVTANSLRIMKIVTDGTKITAWYDRRPWQWITVQPYRVNDECGTFHNSWVNYSIDFFDFAFMKDQLGIVHLRGLIKSGTVGSVALILPTGFRPTYNATDRYLFPTLSNGAAGRIDIFAANGYVTPLTPSNNTWVAVDGLTFKAET